MDHVDMKRIEKIPIKAIGYDLRLDLIDEMEAEDVAELTKVDRQFRSILLQEPWRVFGKHIYEVSIGAYTIRARKLDSSSLKLFSNLSNDRLPNELELSPASASCFKDHLPLALLKRARSAQLFTLILDYSPNPYYISHAMRHELLGTTISTGSLANLKCVNELRCNVENGFLYRFRAHYLKFWPTVMERTRLNFYSNQSIAETFSMVIETRIGACKEIWVRCTGSQYKDIHERLAQAKFEMIVFDGIDTPRRSMLREIIPHIVANGIPSTYKKAVILVKDETPSTRRTRAFFSDYRSLFTDLQQIDEGNHKEINRICRIVIKSLNRFAIAKDMKMLLKKSLYYTKVDDVKKTIYVIDPKRRLFFAKNVSIF